MKREDYVNYDALGLAELVASGEVSALELVEVAVEAIEKVNPELNAVVTRMYTRARKAAEADLPKGPLSGVPFLLKDLLASYKGVRMTSACRFYADYVPDHDSELVKRHRRAGLLTLGKTNCPELGITATTEPEMHGSTHTPWKHGYSSGGSSGGSAAMVGARAVPMAHAGDGGGSIRIPAACCGVFGIKPSRGMLPVGPDASQNWAGLVVEHAVTKTVRDSAALLDATKGPAVDDWYRVASSEKSYLKALSKKPKKKRALRIALTKRPFLPGETHPDCAAAVDQAAKVCESLGHSVEERNLDVDPGFAGDFLTLVSVSTATVVSQSELLLGRKATKRDFERTTWLLNMIGRQQSALVHSLALERLQSCARSVARQFEEFDVLLCPTLGKPPARHGELDVQGPDAIAQKLVVDANLFPLLKVPGLIEQLAEKVFAYACFTPVANVTGQPSMSVPIHWNDQGLPIGTMFTAKLGDDAVLFRLAKELEEAAPWVDREPAIFAG